MNTKTSKTISTIFFIFMCAVESQPAFGQDGYFWMRCAAWSDPVITSIDKQLYISGLKDGLLFADLKIQSVKVPAIQTDATIRAIDDLCKDSGNMMIPIPFILKIVAMKLSGEEDEQIQEELINLRRQFVNAE